MIERKGGIPSSLNPLIQIYIFPKQLKEPSQPKFTPITISLESREIIIMSYKESKLSNGSFFKKYKVTFRPVGPIGSHHLLKGGIIRELWVPLKGSK
jgi:hypothetical protein